MLFTRDVVQKSRQVYKSTWDITDNGIAMLGLVARGNPGKVFYVLDQVDPQPGQIVTEHDIVSKFPFGIRDEEWEDLWDEFRGKDQRRVFKTDTILPSGLRRK